MNRAVLILGLAATSALLGDCAVPQYTFVCGHPEAPAACIDSPGPQSAVELTGTTFAVHVSVQNFTLFAPNSTQCMAINPLCGHIHLHMFDQSGAECGSPYNVLGPADDTEPTGTVLMADIRHCPRYPNVHSVTLTAELRHVDHAPNARAISDTVTDVQVPQ